MVTMSVIGPSRYVASPHDFGGAEMTARDEGDRRPAEYAYAVTTSRKALPKPGDIGKEAAERTLGMPVRRGAPKNIGGLMDVVNSPIYATGVGLVLYGAENQEESPRKFRRGGGMMSRFWKWLGEYV